MAEISEVTIKVNLDTSEVLKNIKSIERRVREAKKAVGELGNANGESIHLDIEKVIKMLDEVAEEDISLTYKLYPIKNELIHMAKASKERFKFEL
ncbi:MULTISPECIES: hypothetical protein [Bacillaceae]|uniref:Uncharacterized protein n=1 Tax=Alkalicoccobacillus plakortidis TaxID=444060 RepID=A0A9D5DN51_9BACI|nr:MULTISPECIES: hypothetical protein [Bacillaceae]KQL55956.1 hypothetical protein AN965_16955 [Alkalicoccobacillus plakortidis]